MRRPPGWVTIKPNLMQIPVFVKWQDVRIGSTCDMPAQLGHVRFAPHTRSDPASSPVPARGIAHAAARIGRGG